jgi:hypothetical protein
MTTVSAQYGRIVNNVTMAMPHVGVSAAARDTKNGIMQPSELGGTGEYVIVASVPSPSLTVLCASLTEDEMKPLIWMYWKTGNATGRPFNASWVNDVPVYDKDQYLNSTVVDDLFQWGKKYKRRPPVFPLLPADYNTIVNATMPFGDTLYILAKAPDSLTKNYTLCGLRSSLNPFCSTWYNATGSGASLQANCGDDSDKLAYIHSNTSATHGLVLSDWKNIGDVWASSLSLGTGITDGNAANSRLLTQLIPTEPALNPVMPSIAEALAVLGGCTLMVSSDSSPFRQGWIYANSYLNSPQYEPFNASLKSQQYTSGYTQQWQGVFYAVLFAVFATNCFCLAYLLLPSKITGGTGGSDGLVTDFTEPQNLFALAVNSPPSFRMAGACGAGPIGNQFRARWNVRMDKKNEHFYIKEQPKGDGMINGKTTAQEYEMRRRMPVESPVASTYTMLADKRQSWWLK